MKAVQIVKPEELRIIETDIPELNETDNVLVKLKAAGICGSDVGIYHGTNAAATYPRVIGHEMVGEVVQTAPGAKKVKVGDRVIIDQVKSCGRCWACRHNRPNVCQHLQVRGVHADGGYREYMPNLWAINGAWLPGLYSKVLLLWGVNTVHTWSIILPAR